MIKNDREMRIRWVDENLKYTAVLLLLSAFFIVSWCVLTQSRKARIIHCALGEARGEGYKALLAHMEAMRNRGTLEGVYGCGVEFSKEEQEFMRARNIYEMAEEAYQASLKSNIVHGATHWGDSKLDPQWIASMQRAGYIRTATVAGTEFYRKP